MATFTKSYAALAGPLVFNVLTDFVDRNGVITTVTLDVPAPGYVLTDIFNITGTTGFNDSITTANGDDNITDSGGTSTTINASAGNDTIAIGGTFTSGTIDGGVGTGDQLTLTAITTDLSVLTLIGLEILTGQAGTTRATAAQFEAFETIRYNQFNPSVAVTLVLTDASGVTLDLFDELNSVGIRGANLTATAGADTLTLGDGGDTVNAGLGSDVVNGNGGGDTLRAGAAVASNITATGNDTLNGGAGNDNLLADGTDGDELNGDGGDDTLAGNAGNDVLNGGLDNDTISDLAGTVVDIDGGDGTDKITIGTTFTSGTIDGGAGTGDELSLTGSTADLSVLTVGGLEVLSSQATTTRATAAQFESFDTIRYNQFNSNVSVTLVLMDTSGVTLDLFDELTSLGIRGANLTATVGADTLTLGDGADTVNGGLGNDIIYGNGGGDTLRAGAAVASSTTATGNDTLNGGEGNDNLSADGNDGDELNGDAGNDTLTGNAGNDVLNGGLDDDAITDLAGTVVDIDGGDGTDAITIGSTFTSGTVDGGAGAGDDLILNGATTDLTLLTLLGFEILSVQAVTARATAAQFEAFETIRYNTFNSSAAVVLSIVSSTSPQTIDLYDELTSLGSRAVTLTGSADDETITTGTASDAVNAGDGNDTADYSRFSNNLTVTMNGATNATVTVTGGNNDTIRNFENFIGGSGNDTITGDGLANALTGGLGTDALSGAAGNDTFVVRAGETASGESYNGGTNDDTLQIDGGGTVNLTGVTFSNMENLITTNSVGTRVILSTAQINAFTGTLDAQGANDTFAVSDLLFLTTFATPATRASVFAFITGLHGDGVENVEWQEGGATTVATVSGANVIVTSTDPAGNTGGLSWATSVFTFDGTTVERLTKVTTMDDGSIVTRTFSSDLVVSDVTTGIPGPQGTRTVQYDTAGRWDSVTVVNDDTSSVATFYDDSNRVDSRTQTAANGFATTTYFNDLNQRTSLVSDDTVSNLYTWKTSTLTLNPLNGQVAQKVTVLDDLNTVTENYSGGFLTTRITQDGGVNEAFTSTTQTFSLGVFQGQSTIYDNGTGLIQGTSANNVINQNNAIADSILGGGGADTFVFAVGGGADRVLDFSQAQGDKLDLRAFGVDDVSEIMSYTQVGANLLMTFGLDTVQVNNITYAALTNADLVI